MSQSLTRVLVVDDDRANLASLQKILEREGFHVETATTGRDALVVARKHRIEVLLTDLMMPAMSGLELMKAVRLSTPDVETVMMTAYGTIETAVESMREGAYDFIEKPLKRMHVIRAVRKAAERQRLVAENRHLKDQLKALEDRSIVGSSLALRKALDLAKQVAPSSANVLLLGASGTGKELLARYIHQQSGVKGKFVAVNLAALPETIVESEVFGHERGAFTGASTKREGRIAQAQDGTLFLDEVGEISGSLQVKLLRVLQEGEFEPVGGTTQYARFRLIAATNRDLSVAVREGIFREDLYYRLNVVAITSPKLAERREDIPLLTEHFIESYCEKNKKSALMLTEDAKRALLAYAWPGNVRELENVIERAVVLAKSQWIDLNDLPEPIRSRANVDPTLHFSIGTPLEEIERQVIQATLDYTSGDKQLAAEMLGISSRTIYRKLDSSLPSSDEASSDEASSDGARMTDALSSNVELTDAREDGRE